MRQAGSVSWTKLSSTCIDIASKTSLLATLNEIMADNSIHPPISLLQKLQKPLVPEEAKSSPHVRLRQELQKPEKATPGFESPPQTGVICTSKYAREKHFPTEKNGPRLLGGRSLPCKAMARSLSLTHRYIRSLFTTPVTKNRASFDWRAERRPFLTRLCA